MSTSNRNVDVYVPIVFLAIIFYIYVGELIGFKHIVYADFSVVKDLLVLERDEISLISIACLDECLTNFTVDQLQTWWRLTMHYIRNIFRIMYVIKSSQLTRSN